MALTVEMRGIMAVEFGPAEEGVYQQIVNQLADPVVSTGGAREVKSLSSGEVEAFGLKLSGHQKFWEIVRSIPLVGRIAGKHLRGCTAKLLKHKNYEAAELLFGIKDKKEFKRLQKQGFIPKYDVLVDPRRELEKTVLRAHHAFLFVGACKDKEHWVHKVLGSSAEDYASVHLRHIRSDFAQFQKVMPIIDSWEALTKLESEAGDQFPRLWRAAEEKGLPNFAKLTRLVDLYKKIEGDSPPGRATLALGLDREFSIGQDYLPPVIGDLHQPISSTDAKQRVKDLVVFNNAVQAGIHKQEYQKFGQRDVFHAFVKESIEGDVAVRGPDWVAQRVIDFNKQSYSDFIDLLEQQYGEALVDPIHAVMDKQTGIESGQLYYGRSEGYDEVALHLEKLQSVRQTFVDCSLENAFLKSVSSKMGEQEWESMAQASAALDVLAQDLEGLGAELQALLDFRSSLGDIGLGDMASQVLAKAGPVTPEGIHKAIVTVYQAVNITLLKRFLVECRSKYGTEVESHIREQLEGDERILKGEMGYGDTKIGQRVLESLSALRILYQPFIDELPEDQIADVINEVQARRAANGKPFLLDDLGSPELTEEMGRSFNKAVLDNRVGEHGDLYGPSFEPFIREYFQRYEPGVISGAKRYDESDFFKATSIEQQIALLKPLLMEAYPSVGSGLLEKLLLEPTGTPSLEKSLNKVKLVHEWTEHLAPNPNHVAKRKLAQQFALALEGKYITQSPGEDYDVKELEHIFRFATDLNKREVYSGEVLCSGISRYLDNRSANVGEALFAGGGLPTKVTGGWFSWPGKAELSLFGHCMRTYSIDAMRQQCEANGGIYGPNEEAFAKLFAMKFTDTDQLPANPEFTLQYVDALSKKAMKIFQGHVLSPARAAGYIEQSARDHKQFVSLSMKHIDTEFVKKPSDTLEALGIALAEIDAEASKQTDVTFGKVFLQARQHTGVTLAAILRCVVEERLPPESRSEAKHIERFLQTLEQIVEKSSFADVDVILDRQQNHQNAEKVRSILSISHAFLDKIHVDDMMGPEIKEVVRTWLTKEIASEIEKVQALPDNANISSVLTIKDAPLATWGCGEILEQIEQARGWRKAMDRGEIKTLPPEAPGFTIFILEWVPKILPYLKRKTTMKAALWAATSAPGKFLLPWAAGPFLKIFGPNLNSEQKDNIVNALPGLLRVVDKMDLTSEKNSQTLSKVVNMLELLSFSVNKPEEPNHKTVSLRFLEAIQDLTPEISDQTDVLLSAFKQMARDMA